MSLIGTSEIPLAGLYSNQIIPLSELPIRLVGFSNCFRAETGSGVHSKGLYRLHQFSKVELFCICTENDSDALHEELLEIQESIVKDLGIPYQYVKIKSYLFKILRSHFK